MPGANDGIVFTASLVAGVAAAQAAPSANVMTAVAGLVVKRSDLGTGFSQFGVARPCVELCGVMHQLKAGGLGVGTVGPQELDYGRQHPALNMGTRRVVRAQSVALCRIQRALEQGAEDGGLHPAPVGFGGVDEQVNLRGLERQTVAVHARALSCLPLECSTPVASAAGKPPVSLSAQSRRSMCFSVAGPSRRVYSRF